MAEAKVELIRRALHCIQRAYNRAANAITPEQENRKLRVLGGKLMVAGVFNTAVSYHAFINPLAIPNYMHVMIPLVVECFTFIAGIIIMATGWFLLVCNNPRRHGCLVKIILLLAFIVSTFTMGMLFQDSSSSGRFAY